MITGAVPLGAIIGSILSGTLTSKYGRRKVLMIIDVLGIISSAIMLIKNLEILLLGRLIAGNIFVTYLLKKL
jgi:predicted MFS family arabinose efflux permease